jgi:hypothetical protein
LVVAAMACFSAGGAIEKILQYPERDQRLAGYWHQFARLASLTP